MSDLIAVSDLHIGDKDFSENDFTYFLHKVANRTDRFVLNGDNFDCSKVGTEDAMEKARQINKYIDQLGCESVFILGNHDNSLKGFRDIKIGSNGMFKRQYNIEIAGIRYRFMHGHQYDEAWLKLKPVVSLYLRFQGWIEKTFKVKRLGSQKSLSGYSKGKVFLKYVDAIVEEAIEHNTDTDFLIIGHAHYYYLDLSTKPKILIIPDWINRRGFIEINGRDITVSAFHGDGASTITISNISL